MATVTKEKDLGHDRIRREIERMKAGPGSNVYVLAGIVADKNPVHKSGEGVTALEVPLYNEFGTKTIPELSFLRSTADETRAERAALAEKLLVDIVIGRRSLDQTLRIMGNKLAAMIKKKITDIKTPPNAPSTIMRKSR